MGQQAPRIWAASWVAPWPLAELCDRSFDAQVRRAARAADDRPAGADALWSRLDRRLSDLAVLVSTVTPSEVDVVSKRTRNCQCNPVWGCCLDQLSVG